MTNLATHNHPVPITFRTLPAMAGLYWVQRGWALFILKPWTIFSAVLLTVLTDLIFSQLSVFGLVFSGLLTPAINLGLMGIIAVRLMPINEGMIKQLLVVFRMPMVLKRMLQLGLIYTLSVCVIMYLSQVLAGDGFFKMQAEIGKGTIKLNDPIAKAIMIDGFSKTLPMVALLMASFWFTSQLVGWHGQSIPKALFFNMMAFWRNKNAFMVYVIAWLVIALGVSLAGVVFMEIDKNLVVLLTALYALMIAWFMCSVYATYESTIQLVEYK
jgi:hypothetical protein